MKTITAPVTSDPTPAPTVETAPAVPAETPETSQPTTAVQLRDLTLNQFLDQKPKYEIILGLGLAPIVGFLTEAIKVGNTLKTQQTEFRSKAKPLGKIIAAGKVAYVQAQTAGTFSGDIDFNDYLAKVGMKPKDTASWNHAQACAVTFAELVLTGRITEKDYDDRTADALAKACTILKANKKNGGDLNSPLVAELVDVLLNSPDDERMARLNKLKNRAQGKTEKAEAGDPEILSIADLKNADVLVRRVCGTTYEANGNKIHGLPLTANIVKEYIGKETAEDVLRSVFHTLYDAMDVFPRELADKFMGEIEIARVERQAAEAAEAATPAEPAVAAA